MARIRSLKPEHGINKKIGKLTDRAYRVWVNGLVCQADDEGRLVVDAEEIRVKVYGHQPKVTIQHVSDAIDEIKSAKLLYTQDLNGKTIGQLHEFTEHQSISHPQKSKLPEVPISGIFQSVPECSGTFQNVLEDSGLIKDQGSRIMDQESRIKEESCGEPHGVTPPPSDEIVLEFPVVGRGGPQWHLTKAKLQEYQGLYPNLDVLSLCRRMRQWCVDNPGKRKTTKGMPAFIGRWLAKEADSPRPQGGNHAGEAKPRPGKYASV